MNGNHGHLTLRVVHDARRALTHHIKPNKPAFALQSISGPVASGSKAPSGAFLIPRFYNHSRCNMTMAYKTCQAHGCLREISCSIYYAMIRSFCTTPCSVSWYCANGLSSLLFFECYPGRQAE